MVKYLKPEVVFGALASKPRRSIVQVLAKGRAVSVSDLAKPLKMSLPGAMKHLKVLQGAGIVTCRKVGRVSYCSINSTALQASVDWLLTQQAFWSKTFDRLEKHLSRHPSSKSPPSPK